MGEKGVLDNLIDKKVRLVLKLFLDHQEDLFHLNKISRRSGVPLTTAFRIVKKLTALDLVKIIQVGKFKLYQVNQNEKTRLLGQLLK
ncbi:MAG: helix-turn-helix domain-containing protein [Nanoarchaeota archaeon]